MEALPVFVFSDRKSSGSRSDSSFIHALVVTATNNVPFADTDLGRFFFPSPTGDYSSTDPETLKMRHVAGHIAFSGNGENGLAQPGLRKEPHDAPRARHVELGEWIVEEHDRRPAASFLQAC